MAGIGGDNRVQIKTGETFIAASQRPDGSWRKERKVKTGYVPQDEQPKYESRGKQETEKGARFPIGLTPVQMQQQTRKGESTSTKKGPVTAVATSSKRPVTAVVKPNAPITVRDHLEKKLEGLRKKLREIDTLQQRIDDGELPTPEKTQLAKIERRAEIVAMMESLELSLSE